MTESATTATDTAIVDRYVEFWNAVTDDEQQRLAEATFAEGFRYCAPVADMRTTEGLIGFRNQFAEFQPGYVFRARSAPEAHHDRARLQWEIVIGDERFAAGTDVFVLDEAHRIASVSSFLDEAPEGFDPDAHDH